MTELIVNITLLTLLFTVAAGGTLILRSTLTRGRESVICVVWAAVLIVSVIPFYSSHAAILRLPVLSDNTEAEAYDPSERLSVVYATEQAGYKSLSDVERDCERVRKIYGRTLTAVEYDTGDPIAARPPDERLDSLSALCYMLFAVWLGGAFVSFIRPYLDFRAVSRILTLNSDRCENRYLNELFASCRAALGIKRKIPLRIAREGCVCSPCTAGLFKPRVFIGADCLLYTDEQLRFIFTHELCHIKRGDLALRLLSLTVCAIHWFNPLSRLVPKLIGEDCELACDGAVLKLFGREKSDSYMFTILDIAESLYRPGRRIIAEASRSSLNMSGEGSRRFLERRYRTMKITRLSRTATVFASLFIAMIFVLNSVIMSSCGINVFGADVSGSGNVFLDEALRGYFNLTADEDITEEMLGAVTEFAVVYSGLNLLFERGGSALNDSGLVYVDYIVNGKAVPALTSEEAGSVLALANTLVPAIALDSDGFQSGDEQSSLNKFFLCASDREINELARYMEESGMLENHKLLNGIFDASCLDALPMLQTVSYLGVTPVNESERTASMSNAKAFAPDNPLGGTSLGKTGLAVEGFPNPNKIDISF